MQAQAYHPNETHTQIFKAVAEKLTTIGSNTYVQWGTMLGFVTLVYWFVTFKVTAENSITRLYEENAALRIELKEMKLSLPSKDWLELKFSNLQEQLATSKKNSK